MDIITFFIDALLHIDAHLSAFVAAYGQWVYLILFLIVFCETGLIVTPFLPGDSLLFVAGTLAATEQINVHLLVALLISAAVLGDNLNYLVGKTVGIRLFRNPHSRIFRRTYLDRSHSFYQKYGGKAILLARFAPILRTFAPFVAGIARMRYLRFLAFSATGSVLWVGLFCYAGFLFGNIPIIRNNLEGLILGVILISCLPGLITWWRERRKLHITV